MQKKWHFSPEDIERMREIPLKDFCEKIGYTVVRHGYGKYRLIEHDSLVIFEDTNTFCRFSTGRGGSIFDLAKELWGSEFYVTAQALDNLYFGKGLEKSELRNDWKKEAKETYIKEFSLPEINKNPTAIADYLCNERKIPFNLVQDFYKKGLIKETKDRKLLFIGYENGKAAYGFKRSLTGKKGDFYTYMDLPGSKKEVGFKYLSENFEKDLEDSNNQLEIYVFESCIDLMSYKAFYDKKVEVLKTQNSKYKVIPAAFISLNGINKSKDVGNHNALKHFLNDKRFEKFQNEGNLKNIKLIFCLDNDDKGRAATEIQMGHFARSGYSIRDDHNLYAGYKDVNEWLCNNPKALEINHLDLMLEEKQKEIKNLER